MVGQVTTSAMAGFAFARLEWRYRDAVFLLYLATLMVPGIVTLLPTTCSSKASAGSTRSKHSSSRPCSLLLAPL